MLAGGLAAAAGLIYLLQFNIRYDTGLPARADRVHGGRARGHREPGRRRARRVLIGLVQAFNEGLDWYSPGGDWTRAIVFVILIAVLVFRPEGLLGERTPEGA